jgi:ABC-2 type transport system permease protein
MIRTPIIRSRYISHITWVLSGMALSAIFAGLTVLIHGNRYSYYDLRDPLSLFRVSIGISLFMGATFYPAIYFLGADRNEIVIIISLLGAVGLTSGIIRLLNAANNFGTLTDPECYILISVFMGIVILSFSLLFTFQIYI